jgi:4-hydroxybenzoate polyprenyltransferase
MKKALFLMRPWYWLPTMASATVGYLFASPSTYTYKLIVVLIVAGPCLSTYAEVVNDICDYRSDSLGSRKKIYGVPLAGGSGVLAEQQFRIEFGFVIAIISALIGIFLCFMVSGKVTLVYSIGLILATAYSIRPIHLKGRGVWSFIAQAIGYGPVAFHIGFFSIYSASTLKTLVYSALIGSWVGAVGLSADLLDLEDDTRNNIQTFVVRLGRTRATCLILLLGAALLSVVIYLTQPATFMQIAWSAIVVSIFTLFSSILWQHRRVTLPTGVHALAIILEILFPFFFLM